MSFIRKTTFFRLPKFIGDTHFVPVFSQNRFWNLAIVIISVSISATNDNPRGTPKF